MPKRKAVSASLRWHVFARDGFRCRYCGAQAGDEGVVLHADHVVSVADGGSNAMDNLVAACHRCNGGKAARSMDSAPGCGDAVRQATAQATTLREQAEALASGVLARQEARQAVVDLLCDAYHADTVRLSDHDVDRFVYLTGEHGPALLADWVSQAAARGVEQGQCLRYVHGIIRRIRERQGA